MDNKKWFMSKKFWTPVVMAAVVAMNNAFGWHIPEDQVLAVAVPFIIYLIGEFFMDAKRESKAKNPLHDPVVRDAIEALVSDAYDYSMARADGIETHAAAVKEKVMAGLHVILDPKYTKDPKTLGGEILRQVLKMYREDQKIKEGADLVRSSMSGGK